MSAPGTAQRPAPLRYDRRVNRAKSGWHCSFARAILVLTCGVVAACGTVKAQPDAKSMPRDGAPDAATADAGVDASACGGVCSTQVQHATGATCTSANQCDYATCVAGYGDVDGDRTNGCESTLPTGVPEASRLVLWLAGDTGWNSQTWVDQSGGGRNATVYSGAPGTAMQNGKYVVDFNGGELLINAGFPNWAGLTVLAVSNTSADDSMISMGVSYNPSCTTTPPAGAPNCVPYDQLAFNPEMSLQQCDPSTGSCYQAYSPAAPLNTWIRTIAEEDPAANPSFHSYLNGVDNGALNHNLTYPYPAPWSTPRADTVLGWRNYRGKVAEIIVFNVPLSDASRSALDQYLATKWNVH